MTDNHPMNLSPSQLDQWEMVARATTDPSLLDEPAIRTGRFGVVHRKALRLAFAAGADEELMACINWLYENGWGQAVDGLRDARRPKPPSLKAGAIEVLDELDGLFELPAGHYNTILRALEQLDDSL